MGVEVIACSDCEHSRIEKHTGDSVRVCWVHKSHGYIVPDDGYCHRAVKRENVH